MDFFKLNSLNKTYVIDNSNEVETLEINKNNFSKLTVNLKIFDESSSRYKVCRKEKK